MRNEPGETGLKGNGQGHPVGPLNSLQFRILLLVIGFVGIGAIALTSYLTREFEEGTRLGVLHEGLLISNLIESSVVELAEEGDAPAIQRTLDRLVSIRERNDIEMNVLFLKGERSDIVASNIADNVEAADPEEHRELLTALARGRPSVFIETEDASVDPDDPASVGPDHPDYYVKPGDRLLNISTPLASGGRSLGSVNVKLSLAELDAQIAVIHDRVSRAMVVAIVSLILGLVLYLRSTLFRPLERVAGWLRQFGQGMRHFAASREEQRTDEIGVLAREFIAMAARLTEAEVSNLRHQENLKRLVFERTSELVATQEATILSMASLAEFRDPETGAHIKRTQNYIRLVAEKLRSTPPYRDVLDDAAIDMIVKSAPLHDIGKVGISDAVLLKAGPLTDAEFEQMKQHPAMGRDAIMAAEGKLGSNSFLQFAREIAYTHHERWDGTGYPQGLSGEDIPISGRLMAIADVYDALISRRCYKPPFSHAEAVDIIVEGRGTHFDPHMVDAFLALEDEFRQIAFEFAESDEERQAVAMPLRLAA